MVTIGIGHTVSHSAATSTVSHSETTGQEEVVGCVVTACCDCKRLDACVSDCLVKASSCCVVASELLSVLIWVSRRVICSLS